jgi:hypothetical protein
VSQILLVNRTFLTCYSYADTAGKFNGKFSGEILELGAAEEVVVPSRDGIQTVML